MFAPIAGIAAVGAGVAGFTGNALFDFALNPRAPHSIMARLRVNMAADANAQGADPSLLRAEAQAWFASARQAVEIPARDGGVLHGWLLPAGEVHATGEGRALAGVPAGSVWGILCHGYAGAPRDLAVEALLAHRMGAQVLMPAARGHERNDDRYVGMGWLDAHDLLDWCDLVVRADPGARIALYGVSMGGAEVMMASGLGLPDQVRCIVEDCGFTSVWDEFAVQMRALLHLPAVPLLNAANACCRARAGYTFREASAVACLARARVPMLFIHGDQDAFVPFRMLDEVYEACASPVKEKLVVPGAGHALAAVTNPDLYYKTIGSFLERHLL